MTLQQAGIVAFSVTVGLNSMGLLIDAALYQAGLSTVSEFASKNQWLAALIIFVNAVGLFGLAVHFSTFNGKAE